MCLIVLAIGQSTEYPLILAGNRDEFHGRPTRSADWWPDLPDIVGGRDLQAGGSWLALHRKGRFATVTNYRDAEPSSTALQSRGHLVTDFLQSELAADDYLQKVDGDQYAGFNLLVGDHRKVAYLSNRGAEARELSAGIYGLSNALLDGPWDKVERTKRGLADLLDRNAVNETTMLRLLNDRNRGPVEEVEATSMRFTLAHAITAPFIVTPEYGTRSTTVVLLDRAGCWRVTERRFNASGSATGESQFSFVASAAATAVS